MKTYWTERQKLILFEQAKTMTVPEMSRAHKRPKREVERVLKQNHIWPIIIRKYMWRNHLVKVFSPSGAEAQHVGNDMQASR